MGVGTRVRNIIAPPDEMIWPRAQKGSATYMELGHNDEVPIFMPKINDPESLGMDVLYDRRHNPYGTMEEFDTESDMGIDYGARLYHPIGAPRYNFYVDIDTPLGTGINGGLNDEVAQRMMRELGVPVLLKGPEFSGKGSRNRIRRLGRAATQSTNISQSYTAETSMEISRQILDMRGIYLPALAYGKSRGGMVSGRKWSYAHERGIEVIHHRLIDPCVAERALDSPKDVIDYASWPAKDMLSSIPSFARFALEAKLRSRLKTVETSPEYLVAMLLGTIPSLLNGENMSSRIPLDSGVSLVHMDKNPIADTPEYLRDFQHHENFDHQQVHDAHIGGIILPRNIGRTIRHIDRFGEAYEASGDNVTRVNFQYVHRKLGAPALAQVA